MTGVIRVLDHVLHRSCSFSGRELAIEIRILPIYGDEANPLRIIPIVDTSPFQNSIVASKGCGNHLFQLSTKSIRYALGRFGHRWGCNDLGRLLCRVPAKGRALDRFARRGSRCGQSRVAILALQPIVFVVDIQVRRVRRRPGVVDRSAKSIRYQIHEVRFGLIERVITRVQFLGNQPASIVVLPGVSVGKDPLAPTGLSGRTRKHIPKFLNEFCFPTIRSIGVVKLRLEDVIRQVSVVGVG